jgi:hypothetical protein
MVKDKDTKTKEYIPT